MYHCITTNVRISRPKLLRGSHDVLDLLLRQLAVVLLLVLGVDVVAEIPHVFEAAVAQVADCLLMQACSEQKEGCQVWELVSTVVFDQEVGEALDVAVVFIKEEGDDLVGFRLE